MPQEHLSNFPRKETLASLAPKADHTRMASKVCSAARSVQRKGVNSKIMEASTK